MGIKRIVNRKKCIWLPLDTQSDKIWSLGHSNLPSVPEQLKITYWYEQFKNTDVDTLKQNISAFLKKYDINYMFIYDDRVKAQTLLGLAADYDRLEIVRYLVEEKNANINIPGNSDYTPMMLAISRGHYSIADYLLNKGADVIRYSGLKTFHNLNLQSDVQINLIKRLLILGDSPNRLSLLVRSEHNIKAIRDLQQQLLKSDSCLMLIKDRIVDLTWYFLLLRVVCQIDLFGLYAFVSTSPIKIAKSINEFEFSKVMKILEDINSPFALLTCGLLLQGLIENDIPNRYQDENEQYEHYLTKRVHDAITFYIKASVNKQLSGVVSEILWDLKMKAYNMFLIKSRISQFDINIDFYRRPIGHVGFSVKMKLIKEVNKAEEEEVSKNTQKNIGINSNIKITKMHTLETMFSDGINKRRRLFNAKTSVQEVNKRLYDCLVIDEEQDNTIHNSGKFFKRIPEMQSSTGTKYSKEDGSYTLSSID